MRRQQKRLNKYLKKIRTQQSLAAKREQNNSPNQIIVPINKGQKPVATSKTVIRNLQNNMAQNEKIFLVTAYFY